MNRPTRYQWDGTPVVPHKRRSARGRQVTGINFRFKLAVAALGPSAWDHWLGLADAHCKLLIDKSQHQALLGPVQGDRLAEDFNRHPGGLPTAKDGNLGWEARRGCIASSANVPEGREIMRLLIGKSTGKQIVLSG